MWLRGPRINGVGFQKLPARTKTSSWCRTGKRMHGVSMPCQKQRAPSTVLPFKSCQHAQGGLRTLFRTCYISIRGPATMSLSEMCRRSAVLPGHILDNQRHSIYIAGYTNLTHHVLGTPPALCIADGPICCSQRRRLRDLPHASQSRAPTSLPTPGRRQLLHPLSKHQLARGQHYSRTLLDLPEARLQSNEHQIELRRE